MSSNEIEVINVVNEDSLEELVKGSALTWVGMSVDPGNLKDIVDWIEMHTAMKSKRVYVTSGKIANEAWSLTGDNAYPDDLNIVSVKLSDMENFNKIVLPRFQVGGRWMDDIKDNNIRRERMCA